MRSAGHAPDVPLGAPEEAIGINRHPANVRRHLGEDPASVREVHRPAVRAPAHAVGDGEAGGHLPQRAGPEAAEGVDRTVVEADPRPSTVTRVPTSYRS